MATADVAVSFDADRSGNHGSHFTDPEEEPWFLFLLFAGPVPIDPACSTTDGYNCSRHCGSPNRSDCLGQSEL